MIPVLVSACLLGLSTRYDGTSKESDLIKSLGKKYFLIPFCPEQLGGLTTPRPAADLYGGDGLAVIEGKAKVITKDGQDVTEAFVRGAYESLKLARLLKIKRAFLKARSPSCGLSPLMGVTAALFSLEGFKIEEID
ncbi:protein of unknown function DUF523 [Thermodesulfatator indicus DSM 15286]|uniref:Uncharacterized protein n=1 Tax=Thermodesulfatator indicus (strain DSM 15286 / JCM 11887 / CIR29812) TaxID=667014 RepID=F8AD59_THEID|nr:DUF523 domain-containing protein [Thermodesulfatator indicus]AEH44791.1 protein of unknown function DUF523 [Thermodesulfatator indicus DSM 15286]